MDTNNEAIIASVTSTLYTNYHAVKSTGFIIPTANILSSLMTPQITNKMMIKPMMTEILNFQEPTLVLKFLNIQRLMMEELFFLKHFIGN